MNEIILFKIVRVSKLNQVYSFPLFYSHFVIFKDETLNVYGFYKRKNKFVFKYSHLGRGQFHTSGILIIWSLIHNTEIHHSSYFSLNIDFRLRNLLNNKLFYASLK